MLTKARILALTYDDGPSETVTPELLDVLRTHGASATFFMLGEHAVSHPDIVNRVISEGHDVGCHSGRHVNACKALPWTALADIRAGYRQLSRWIPPSAMFRPPNGKITLATYWMLRGRGASVWWWTVDSGDTHDPLPDPGLVVETVRREGGGIVLMHDLDRDPQRNNFVLQLTADLLELAKADSLRVMPLGAVCQ